MQRRRSPDVRLTVKPADCQQRCADKAPSSNHASSEYGCSPARLALFRALLCRGKAHASASSVAMGMFRTYAFRRSASTQFLVIKINRPRGQSRNALCFSTAAFAPPIQLLMNTAEPPLLRHQDMTWVGGLDHYLCREIDVDDSSGPAGTGFRHSATCQWNNGCGGTLHRRKRRQIVPAVRQPR